MKKSFAIKNEKGAAMITALMMLVILTLIGLAATTTTIMEREIANNEVSYKKAFYKADSGVAYALKITRSDINQNTPKNTDLTPAGVTNFKLYLKMAPTPDESYGGNQRFEVKSVAQGKDGQVTIEAGILFPSASSVGTGPGNETDYNV